MPPLDVRYFVHKIWIQNLQRHRRTLRARTTCLCVPRSSLPAFTLEKRRSAALLFPQRAPHSCLFWGTALIHGLEEGGLELGYEKRVCGGVQSTRKQPEVNGGSLRIKTVPVLAPLCKFLSHRCNVHSRSASVSSPAERETKAVSIARGSSRA